MTDNEPQNNDARRARSSNGRKLNRRGTLRLGAAALGTSAVGIGGISSAGASSTEDVRRDAGDYTELIIPEDECWEIWIDDGEVFENYLFDVTADNASVIFFTGDHEARFPITGANDWRLRNVGIRGVCADPTNTITRVETRLGEPTGVRRTGESAPSYLMFIAESDPNGTSVVENTFLDGREPVPEGADDLEYGDRGGGSSLHRSGNSGTIEMRNNFVAGCGDNAAYLEAWGSDSFPNKTIGNVRHINCYHRDNSTSNFRVNMPGDEIVDSVVVMNDPEGTRGEYPWGPGTYFFRGEWNRGHDDQDIENGVTLDNVHFFVDPADVGVSSSNPLVRHHGRPMGDSHFTHVASVTANPEYVNLFDSPEGAVSGVESQGDSGTITIDDIEVGDPKINTLGEGVPTTPEMAAEGRRMLPPDPWGRAPKGGVPGRGTN